MNIEEFRSDNIVSYYGPLGRKIPSRIIEINILNGQESYKLQNIPDGRIFIGYQNEIIPVIITEGILKELGFIKNDDTNEFSKDNLSIIKIANIKMTVSSELEYEDLGAKIIPNGLARPFPANLLIDCTHLHSLQNYCSDNKISGINFNTRLLINYI